MAAEATVRAAPEREAAGALAVAGAGARRAGEARAALAARAARAMVATDEGAMVMAAPPAEECWVWAAQAAAEKASG